VVFTYRVVGLKSDHSKQPVAYRGVDAADKFVEYMVMEEEEIEHNIKHCAPMFMIGSDFDHGYLEEEQSMIHSFTVTFGAKYLTGMVTSVPPYETSSLI
jgi:hypothetical protein